MKKSRVILITNMISPYRIPLFNHIKQSGQFDFRVIVLAEKEQNREWMFAKERVDFDYRILPGWHLFFARTDREILVHLNIGILKALRDYDPDVIVTSGYDSVAYWMGFLYAKLLGKRFVLWNGTTALSTGSVRGIRGLLKRIIINGADKYIAYGTKAKEYLESFGASPQDIYISTNTVDTQEIRDGVRLYRNSREFLEERGKYPELLIMYVGRLVRGKGVEQILRSLAIIRDAEIGFVIVGSGPEENSLRQFCRSNGIENVFFEGFRQPQDLLRYYALADILVLPTFREVWGLVINEALASGLYVISSSYAGATYDLIRDANGHVIDPYNIQDIVSSINESKKELAQLRAKREEICDWANEEFNIARSGDSFVSAICSSVRGAQD